jgi:adenosylcobinamide-GDP ribazoletransferase
VRALLAPPVLAVQFLTAVPVPVSVAAGPKELGRSLALFPLVGGLLGLALAGVDWALLRVLPVPVATVLVLIAGTLLTGGLHLDGLMDTCDGVFGGRTRERRLEIMRDSRVGSYGVLAGALQLLLKYAALVALPGGWRWVGLVLALTYGRWAMAAATWAFPYARAEGLGSGFKAGMNATVMVVATALAIGIAWLAGGGAYVWVRLVAMALFAAMALLAWAVAAWLARKVGGLTGDCYGAINEVVESATLVGLLVALVVADAQLRPQNVLVGRL